MVFKLNSMVMQKFNKWCFEEADTDMHRCCHLITVCFIILKKLLKLYLDINDKPNNCCMHSSTSRNAAGFTPIINFYYVVLLGKAVVLSYGYETSATEEKVNSIVILFCKSISKPHDLGHLQIHSF